MNTKLLAFVALLSSRAVTPARLPEQPGAVQIQMHNVNLRIAQGVVLQIRSLYGRMIPTSHEHPVTLDKRDSFNVEVESAVIAVDTSSLSHLMNTYVFAYEGAPLKNLSVTAKDGRLVQKGTMHKGIDVPFEFTGSVSPTADGVIRLHAEKATAEHLPVKGLLHLFGEDLSKLVNTNEARGARMEGDDIYLFPSRMMPPPHILGKVTAVRVEGNNVVQTFGSGSSSPLHLPAPAANYIYHWGGNLRFGKLTMTDADLEIIDENPKTPFDFSLDDYNRQLVAGYSQNTPSHGLIVHMPDYGQIGRKPTKLGR
jgi:hypothetical protein